MGGQPVKGPEDRALTIRKTQLKTQLETGVASSYIDPKSPLGQAFSRALAASEEVGGANRYSFLFAFRRFLPRVLGNGPPGC